MAYAVNFSRRAERELDLLLIAIDAENSDAALRWFFRLQEAILTLEQNPTRCPVTPENRRFRHLLHGKKPDVYRVIFEISESTKEVNILHIRHGARAPFTGSDLN